MTHRPHARLVSPLLATAAVLLGLLPAVLLAAPAQSAGQSAGRAAGDPDYQRPVVGECHDYSYRTYTGLQEPSAAVDCAGPHVAVTLAVDTVAKRFKLSATKSPAAAAFTKIGRDCLAAESTTLGLATTKIAKTAYAVSYYFPTKQQLAQGARWVRCDLVLPAGRKLADLPSPLPGSGDQIRRCINLAGNTVLTTPCSRLHEFRSTRVITVAGPYPGVPRLQRLAKAHCQLGHGVSWFASWPSKLDWDQGHHRWVVCYRGTGS